MKQFSLRKHQCPGTNENWKELTELIAPSQVIFMEFEQNREDLLISALGR